MPSPSGNGFALGMLGGGWCQPSELADGADDDRPTIYRSLGGLISIAQREVELETSLSYRHAELDAMAAMWPRLVVVEFVNGEIGRVCLLSHFIPQSALGT